MQRKSNTEDIVELKRKLALRQNEPELRTFEEKLRSALAFKEQILQMKEKRLKLIREEVERRREHETLTNILLDKEDVEKILKRKKFSKEAENAKVLELQMDLQRQILKRNEQKIQEEKIALVELEEELLHIRTQENIHKKNKVELLNYETILQKKIKEVQEHKSKLTSLEEEKKSKEYENLRNERELERLTMVKIKLKRKEEMFQKMAANTLAQEKSTEERKKLIKELRDHEHAINQMQNDTENEQKNIFRKELMKMLKKQIELQSEHEKKLKDEELRFKQQFIEHSKEEEKLQSENKKLFDLINKKYSYDIQLQMEINKKRSDEEKKNSLWAAEYINQYNKEKMKIIQEEKIALLEEYDIL